VSDGRDVAAVTVSEFDKLRDDAEQYGENAAEKKLGQGGQDQYGQQDQGGQDQGQGY
jgi:hypothetical protein